MSKKRPDWSSNVLQSQCAITISFTYSVPPYEIFSSLMRLSISKNFVWIIIFLVLFLPMSTRNKILHLHSRCRKTPNSVQRIHFKDFKAQIIGLESDDDTSSSSIMELIPRLWTKLRAQFVCQKLAS